MKFSISVFVIFILSGCSGSHLSRTKVNNASNAWITAFKDRVFIKCLEHSYPNSDSILLLIGKTDAFNPYDGIYDYLDDHHKLIDSLGGSIPKNIPPLWVEDFKGRNTYLCSCLHYYASPKLDAIAKRAYKTHINEIKK
ncbi:MAG TPA: hypothetical protein VJ552_13615 [Sediminibacterium sp.]|nr:hypothetical protein [Sediminibacterium sp.]